MNPPGGFTSGNIYTQVIKIESGVTLYLKNLKTQKEIKITKASDTKYEVENGSVF
jgi:hypothetical protein